MQPTHTADPQESARNAPRSGIVWLASYPKSGNTWTRVFLHNLVNALSGSNNTQHINAIDRFTSGVNGKHLYAAILGFEPTNEHRDEIAAVRHEVQRGLTEDYDGLLFIKTHQALVVDRGTTTINLEVTAGAIYVVRNPLDIAISYAHHSGITIDKTIDIMSTTNAELPVSEKQVNEIYGTWSQHVLSWTRKPHQAIYVMRYEDMLAEPEKTFGGLARHLLFSPTQQQLADAIKASSFDELRAQENREGFREKSKKAERFFREGKAGQWKDVLNQRQIDRIVKDHGEQMSRFGYLPN